MQAKPPTTPAGIRRGDGRGEEEAGNARQDGGEDATAGAGDGVGDVIILRDDGLGCDGHLGGRWSGFKQASEQAVVGRYWCWFA